MAIWVLILFLAGLIAWVFNLFTAFSWFTPWWAVALMVVSLTMLARVCERERDGEKEKLLERIEELEAMLKF